MWSSFESHDAIEQHHTWLVEIKLSTRVGSEEEMRFLGTHLNVIELVRLSENVINFLICLVGEAPKDFFNKLLWNYQKVFVTQFVWLFISLMFPTNLVTILWVIALNCLCWLHKFTLIYYAPNKHWLIVLPSLYQQHFDSRRSSEEDEKARKDRFSTATLKNGDLIYLQTQVIPRKLNGIFVKTSLSLKIQ